MGDPCKARVSQLVFMYVLYVMYIMYVCICIYYVLYPEIRNTYCTLIFCASFANALVLYPEIGDHILYPEIRNTYCTLRSGARTVP